MAKAELTTVENFKIVTGMEAMDEELRAELEDELDDLDDDGASMPSTSRSRLAEEKPSRSRQTIRTIRRS
ncbi:hypothetical protein DWV78_09300 [Agathobacter rectalis]|uniref:Uncharacterized protein n=1 Tax=Agathobacter rectalis TaxID=39491 RepID=A0A413BFR1_9FIRM|nr:hypothetical protein DWV78_09300 [Agathobacter rectalis]